MRLVCCYHSKILISQMSFPCFRFCLLCNKLESVRHCLWVKKYHGAIHSSKIWKQKAVLQSIHTRSLKMKIPKCLCVRFIFISLKTKHPIYIMVFWLVTSKVDVMPPFFFQHSLRFNTKAYIKCLEEVVPPWIKRMAMSSN